MSTQPNTPLGTSDDFLATLESSASPTTFRQLANILLERGIPLIPLKVRSKDPSTEHGVYDGTTDAETISRWIDEYPAASNCGARASFDGYWFQDDDMGTLAVTYKVATGLDLPSTFTVKTSRGFHYYFVHDDTSRAARYGGKENAVIDIPGYKGEARCNNQYVVGPGSVHPSGAVYEIYNDAPIVAAPASLLAWLQIAYALSETLKGKSTKMQHDRQADPGFNKLFDVVGWKPLIDRLRNHTDARFHAPVLKPGKLMYCPIPGHYKPEDKGKAFNSEPFGVLKDAAMVHCFGCGFSGDMVAAVYALDGGKKRYKNMYACARAICKECNLKFEDFFPVKPTSAATTAETFVESGTIPTVRESGEVVRPILSETAYYGLAGAITKKLEPCTESHPAGLLLELMVSFGNMLGRCAYIQVEDTKHFTNEFMVKVGESSRSRKGTGKNRIRAIMEQVDPEWLRQRNVSGIGSGEVIIHLVRDPHTEYFFDKKKGTGARVTTDAGIDDKRLCVNLGEFQGILSVCHRPDNLLSVVMRDGWDGLPLHNLVKTNPASCAEGLLSLLADVTRADLTVSLSQADRANGFANRFLWAYVYRTKLLPEGGGDMDWSVEVPQLRQAVEFGRQVGRVFMDKAARDRWCRTVYPKLEREVPGIVGALTARASAHTMRLALLYALFDKSDHIRLEHLEAAEGLWQYCEDSVQAIFGNLLSPEQSKILEFLAGVDCATKTQLIHDCFKKNRKADLIDDDLQALEKSKKITRKEFNGGHQYRLVRGS
jgi:hypothetical protein